MFQEFGRYFNLYWSYKVVEKLNKEMDSYEEALGHPSGNLERIRYLGDRGGGSTRDQCLACGTRTNAGIWYVVG